MAKFLFVLVSILVCQFCITVDSEVTYARSGCVSTDFNSIKGSVYEKNLNLLFKNLTSKSSSRKYFESTVGEASKKVYGLFQCRIDIGLDDCSTCVKEASQKIIEDCPLYGEAIVWYYECMLRYANNRNFFALYEKYPGDKLWEADNVSNYAVFAPIFAKEINGVIKNASSVSPHFAYSEANLTVFDSLYTFAQCTPDIDSFGCNSCLKTALSNMISCCNASLYTMIFLPSCQLRYDMSPFLKFGATTPAPLPPPATDQGSGTNKKTSLKTAIIGAIAAACVLVGLLVLSVVLWICLCRKTADEVSSVSLLASPAGMHDDPETEKFNEESLGDKEFAEYDFETLKIATKNFSAETMLGEGGFGKVYKGTLENGQEIAIKRLSKGTTGQGTKEFMTESRVLAKLQHRNLVKLFGFCSDGDEKLLIYEFLSNASLDGFLFDPERRSLLDWTTRNKIIMGIARGLQYLHEDSWLIIIHRDLKPGNILLDTEMNPKVADFGLAKLCESAQKFGNTARIVGTQGYMAPEYLISGDYSAKSDVYSFGIMLLEIVSGQKCRTSNRSQQKEDLSIQAWRLSNEDRSQEIIDPVLINNCSSNEVMRCIQIGLLCIQANAEERPTMGAVIVMLTCSSELPSPSPPMMISSQYNMDMSYSADKNSTKSVTMGTDMDQDLYPKPR